MNIVFDLKSIKPIYLQIEECLREQIMKGKLEAFQVLPSIRELAKDLKVSVITIKRSYDDLEREGFICSRHGKGTFVAGMDNEDIKFAKSNEFQSKFAELFIDASIVLEKEEIEKIIKQVMEKK